MDRIQSFDQLLKITESVKGKQNGYLTNFYHNPNKVSLWVKNNMLFYLLIEDTLFVLKENSTFYSIFYFTTDIVQLSKALSLLRLKLPGNRLIVDIIGNENTIKNIESTFTANSFKPYESLCRMSRANSEKEPNISSNIEYAILEDALSIELLLNQYFDPLCEQIPLLEEIIEWIELKHILVYKEDKIIEGFLIFDLTGVTSYLRYWFTHPEYRDKKIGSQLLRRYFFESNLTKRQLFWVIEHNENAIKRYRHYGFEFENLFDKVLINQP